MLKWVVTALLIVSSIVLQACAPKSQKDCGFIQNVYGERISWKGQIPITMYIHSSVPGEYHESIYAAARVWDAQAGKKIFNIVVQTETTPIIPHKDGHNIIYMLDNWENDRNTEQGRTSVYWVGDQIKEADIRLNGRFNFYSGVQAYSSNAVSMESLVLHEMGHVLGLKHNDQDASVMATYLPAATNRTELAAADTYSLQCEY